MYIFGNTYVNLLQCASSYTIQICAKAVLSKHPWVQTVTVFGIVCMALALSTLIALITRAVSSVIS